jgi:hypothetical protein
MRPFARPRLRTLPRAAIARACCLLVAAAVLFGVVHAGARYFYCEGLGLSTTDPCAQVAEQRAPCPLASFERAPFDCCQVLTMPSMPDGARSVAPTVPSAGVIAILPPAPAVAESQGGRSIRAAREGERWRAPPKSARERRAQLNIFLT